MFLLSYSSVNLHMLGYAIFRQLSSLWQVPCFLLGEGWHPVVLSETQALWLKWHFMFETEPSLCQINVLTSATVG